MKLKITILTLFLLFASFTGFNQNRSITFIDSSWSSILVQAKAQNKMIFLDAYAVWCGPCKWMSSNMFTNDSIADYYNKTFICASLDMEKGAGIQLAKVYKVKAYPTLLFITPDGEMVHKRVGAPQKVQDYLDMGVIALTPGEGLSDCEKKFQAGDRDPQFILKYLGRLKDAYTPVDEPLKQYFSTPKDTNLLSRPNWEIIYQYLTNADLPVFDYLLKHQQDYAKLYTADSVNSKIYNVYLQSLIAIKRSRTLNLEETYKILKQKIMDSGYDQAEKVIFTADLSTISNDKFLEFAYNGVDKWYLDDYDMLYRLSKAVLNNTKEVKYLEKAASWAKRSIELKSTAENNDTYAGLMFKLGKKEEAVKFEKTALELATKEKLPLKEYEGNLKKFQE